MLKQNEYKNILPKKEIILTDDYSLEIDTSGNGPLVWNLDSEKKAPVGEAYVIRTSNWISETQAFLLSDINNLFHDNKVKLETSELQKVQTLAEASQFTAAAEEIKYLKNLVRPLKINSIQWMLDTLLHDFQNFLWANESPSAFINRIRESFCSPTSNAWANLIYHQNSAVSEIPNALNEIAITTLKNVSQFNPLDFQQLLSVYQNEKLINFTIKVCRIFCIYKQGDVLEALKRIKELPRVFPKRTEIAQFSHYLTSLLEQNILDEPVTLSQPLATIAELFPNLHTIQGWAANSEGDPVLKFQKEIEHHLLTKISLEEMNDQIPKTEITLNSLNKTLTYKGNSYQYHGKPLLFNFIFKILMSRKISYSELVKQLDINPNVASTTIDNLFSRVKSDFLGLIHHENGSFMASNRPTFIVSSFLKY